MIETITFAFCAYAKTLHELKATLRGLPFDHILFINDMKMLDDIIVDQCPNNDNYNEQYDKIFLMISYISSLFHFVHNSIQNLFPNNFLVYYCVYFLDNSILLQFLIFNILKKIFRE